MLHQWHEKHSTDKIFEKNCPKKDVIIAFKNIHSIWYLKLGTHTGRDSDQWKLWHLDGFVMFCFRGSKIAIIVMFSKQHYTAHCESRIQQINRYLCLINKFKKINYMFWYFYIRRLREGTTSHTVVLNIVIPPNWSRKENVSHLTFSHMFTFQNQL